MVPDRRPPRPSGPAGHPTGPDDAVRRPHPTLRDERTTPAPSRPPPGRRHVRQHHTRCTRMCTTTTRRHRSDHFVQEGSLQREPAPQRRHLGRHPVRPQRITTVAAAAAVIAAIAAPATAMAAPEGSAAPVSVVVRELPGTGAGPERAVAAFGGTAVRQLGIIGGFSADVPADRLADLRATPGVDAATEDAGPSLQSTDGRSGRRPQPGARPRPPGPAGPAHHPDRRRLSGLHPRQRAAGRPAGVARGDRAAAPGRQPGRAR